MIFKLIFNRLRSISLALSVAIFATPQSACAASIDEVMVGAYDAYRAGDAMKLSRHAAKLQGHLLESWADYWRLSMVLEDASKADVEAFFAEHGSTYAGELLRAE